MASTRVLVVFSIIAVIVSTTMATEIIVGDATGWTEGFNYDNWAKDKDFRVGDKLVFNYEAGHHNVFTVNGTEFKECTAPSPGKALTSGNDIITLETSGKKWYICGFEGHCQNGQKVTIFVRPQPDTALPPHAWAPTPEVSGGYDMPYY